MRNIGFEKEIDDKERCVEAELTARYCGLKKEVGWALGTRHSGV